MSDETEAAVVVVTIEMIGARLVDILSTEGHDHECDALVTGDVAMCDCWWGKVKSLAEELRAVQEAAIATTGGNDHE